MYFLYQKNYEKSLDGRRHHVLTSPSAHNMLWSAVRVIPIGLYSAFSLFSPGIAAICVQSIAREL